MYDYYKYCLKENPFPITAAIDPADPDPRMNGTIFLEDIFTKELQDLCNKTERKVNLVYISGIEHDKGVGKSALMIHHWRQCLHVNNCTALYIKLEEKDKPRDICRKIIIKWHEDETLWKIFKAQFLEFCEAKSNPMLRKDSVQYLFEKNPHLCTSLPLTLYTQIRDSDIIVKQFIKYLEARAKTKLNHVEPLFTKYLTEPTNYPQTLESSRVDTIAIFENLIRIFTIQGTQHHYIFMDQFEDMITGSNKRGIAKLSLEIKKILLAGTRYASFYVTLHPNSEMLLQGMEAKDLTGMAPLDTIHRVNVMVLDRKGDQAIMLAKAYLDYYRITDPPYSTFPIEEELINFLNYIQGGNIRALLQNLYNCIEYACIQELDELTLMYALNHPQQILGREIDQKQIERFYKKN